MSLVSRTLEDLSRRRQTLLDGNINSLPPPFPRFKDDFIGFEQGSYVIVSSFTKGGKTQFTLNMLFKALDYVYKHQNIVRMKVFYYNLEETAERILQRFICWLLEEKSGIRISGRDLRSSSKDNPVDESILQLLREKEYMEYLEFFEKVFTFSTTSNPTGIYKECKKYAEEHGVIHTKKAKYKDELGVLRETDTFDYYESNDPFEYRFVVVDHISLIDSESGLTKKQSIDKLSEYLAKHLRNNYGFSPIVIQQQSTEAESNESFKLGRVRPSIMGLSDSKYTARDGNIVFGLFSPYKFGIKEYLGYDITFFKDNIRFLEVLCNRDGESGGIIALYFDGATCSFYELPKPDDSEGLQKVYTYIRGNRSSHQIKSFFIKTFNQLTNGKLLHYFR